MQSGADAHRLLDHSAGTLDSAQARIVEQHLAICAACTAFVEAQRSVWKALDDWDRIEISADFNRRLYQRIDREELDLSPLAKVVAMARARWTPLTVKQAASAAAICATVAMAIFVDVPAWRSSKPTAEPQIEKTEIEQVETALEDLDMLTQFKLAKTR